MSSITKRSLVFIFYLCLMMNCVEPEEYSESHEDNQLVEKTGHSSASFEQEIAPISTQTSDCGGFPHWTTLESPVTQSDPDDSYCDAEVLHWQFDQPDGIIQLTHRRVSLNCCGDHSIRVSKNENTYVVTEIDEPQDRCRCMCVFDFSTQFPVSSIGEEQMLDIRLDLHVTDQTATPQTVHSGTLPLGEGSGTIVLNTNSVMGCY